MSTEPRIKNLPRYFTLFVASMVAIGPFSIDTYLPAMPMMAEEFGVSIERINFTIITYVIGYGIAQLIGGPLSDQIGRKKIGILGLGIYIPCTLLITLSDSVTTVQILRGIQAFGGGFATVICMALIRDAYEPEEAARRLPQVFLVMLTAPLIAPALGTLLLGFGWASIFIFLALYGVVVLFFLTQIPETAPDLTHKINPKGFIPQYRDVVSRRENGKLVPLRYVLAAGLSSGCLIVFIANASFLYIMHYDLSETAFPIFFGINILTMMFFTVLTSKLLKVISPYRIFRIGLLGQLTTLTTLAVISTFIAPPLWLFTVLISLTIGMTGLISPSVTALFMAYFERLAGSASSILSVSVFGIGAALAALSQVFFDNTITPIIYAMLIGVFISNVIAFTIPNPIMPISKASTV